MPSLKDLKTRIASVKSTRKITKAMQMVAAAKLRRAQEAAEQARPYAERFASVLSSLARGMAGSDGAPRLLGGTGREDTHLLVVMTAERGLCGGFNSSIVKLAKVHADRLRGQGKTVKILTVGKKGREQLRRDYGDLHVGHVDLSEVKRVGYQNAVEIAKDVLTRFDAGEFDVATLFFARFQSVISQNSHGPADHPHHLRGVRRRRRCQRLLRLRAGRGGNPVRVAAPRRRDADIHRASGKRGLRTGRADERHGQRDPQRGRDDRPADDRVQPLAPGRHHQ